MANETLAGIRSEVVARLRSDIVNRLAVVGTPTTTFSGRPARGVPTRGVLVAANGTTRTDAALARIGLSRLGPALADAVGFEPGPMAAGLLAVLGDGDAAVYLYVAHVDRSGAHPAHPYALADGGLAEVGSVVLTRREVMPDGSLGEPRETCAGNAPGWHPEIPAPGMMGANPAIANALINLRDVVVIAKPTDEELARDWRAPDEGHETPDHDRGHEAHRGVTDPDDAVAGVFAVAVVDLDAIAAKLRKVSRAAYLPETRRPGPGDGFDAPGNGEAAFIPEGTEWPSEDGEPLPVVLQFPLDSAPEPVRELLGGTGLFQFFCSGEYHDEGRNWHARVVDHRGKGRWETLEDAGDSRPQRLVLVGWREVGEAPHLYDIDEGAEALGDVRFGEDESEAVDSLSASSTGEARISDHDFARAVRDNRFDEAAAKAVADLLCHHDGDKLMGWPTWCQGPEWPEGPAGKGMIHLLQLSFDEGVLAPAMIAGDGQAHLFVSADGERRFAFNWACG